MKEMYRKVILEASIKNFMIISLKKRKHFFDFEKAIFTIEMRKFPQKRTRDAI